MSKKTSGWLWLGSALLGGGALAYALWPREAQAARAIETRKAPEPSGPPGSEVTMTVKKFKRTWKEKWRGTKPPADIKFKPKFNVNQRVKIVTPPEQGTPDPVLEGKQTKVTQLVWSEVQAINPDGTTFPLPEPGNWSYVLDLKVEGQPVAVDGSVLKAA